MRFVSRILILSTFVAACGSDTPTAPEPVFRPVFGGDARVLPICKSDGQDVVCRALVINSEGAYTEVTASARWGAIPSDIAAVIAPGRFRPLRSGELTIDVQMDGAASLETPIKFLVEPNRNARPMVILWVTVQEVENGRIVRIDGAAVEMLDGYRTGTTCATVAGLCLIEYVPAGATYTVRVSKSAYQTITVTHEVVESGVPFSPLTVTLARQ